MDWGTGKMVEMPVAPKLERGHIIYAYGYACNLQMFAVTDPETRRCVEIDRHPVNSIDDLPDDYFSATHTYDERIEPHSKHCGIGFYYADKGEPLATEEQLNAGLERAANIERFKAEKKEIDAENMRKAIEAARKQYGSILTEVQRHSDYKTAANNLRTLIKREFPGVKFSLRASRGSYGYYYLDWNDGPTRERMQKLVGMFDDKVRDRYNDDLWDSVETGFTHTYGSLDVIMQRDVTYETKCKVAECFNLSMDDHEQVSKADMLNAANNKLPEEWRQALVNLHVFYEVSTPQGWCCSLARELDWLPEPKKTEKKAAGTNEQTTGVSLVDYSEKAIAVVGDTRPIADKLKGLGGRFNARLSCGPGWIFSKKKESELKAVLAI